MDKKSEPINFSLSAELRAVLIETLRMAGCPCLAERVLEETIPSHTSTTERDKVLDDVVWVRTKFFEWISTKIQSPSIYACEQKWNELIELRTTPEQP